MHVVKGVFCLGIKESLTKMTVSIIAIFLLLNIFFLQLGINQYLYQQEENQYFIQNEIEKEHRIDNPLRYGLYGVIIQSNSSPLRALFFNSSPFSNLEAFIDISIRLRINNSLAANGVFENSQSGVLDLSWFWLLIGGFLSLLWGYRSFRNREYIKYLLGFSKSKNALTIFSGILLSKIIPMLLTLLFSGGLIIAQFYINNIQLSGHEIGQIFLFISISIIYLLFLLLLGSILSTIKGNRLGLSAAFGSWLLIIILIPNIMYTAFSKVASSEIISIHKHEIQKLNILRSFENKVKSEFSKHDTPQKRKQAIKKIYDESWKANFNLIENLETEMRNNIYNNYKKLHLMSIISPSTFLIFSNNEISSLGFNQYNSFYRYTSKKYKDFVRYYLDHFFREPSEGKRFIDKDQLVFEAKSSLPHYFKEGLLLNLFYILVLLAVSYARFRSILFTKPGKPEVYKTMDFTYSTGKHYIYYYSEPEFPKVIFSLFNGNLNNFPGIITLDGGKINPSDKQNICYLPDPGSFPAELTPRAILRFISDIAKPPKDEVEAVEKEFESLLDKNFDGIKRVDKIRFLFKASLLTHPEIVIFNNFLRYVFNQSLKEYDKGFKGENYLIINMAIDTVRDTNFDRCSTLFLKKTGYEEVLFGGERDRD